MKIKLENITKSYDGKTVLQGVDFSSDGGITAIMGESGSGKTTLLRIICGLEKADGGSVSTDGIIAVAFAEPRLFESISVLENILCVTTGDKVLNREKAFEILRALGLSGEENKKPAELSTGMAQRVSLARAIASEREIYLLDEPLRGLDDKTRAEVAEYIKNFLGGRCAVVVTHSTEEAELLGAKIFHLENGKLY